MEDILEKIVYFEIEVAKADLYSDLYKQMNHLENVSDNIDKYLNNELKNAGDGRTIEMTIAEVHRIKKTYLKGEFIKDEKKRITMLVQKINEAKAYLNTALKMLKDYVSNGDVISK